MPGRDKLARDLGVHGSTIERALQLLKKSRPGKSRGIIASATPADTSAAICLLLYNKEDVTDDHINSLQYHILAAGHNITFAPRTMRDLKFDPDRVEAMVRKQSADAWIVCAGPKPVLERFVRMSVPTYAFPGGMRRLLAWRARCRQNLPCAGVVTSESTSPPPRTFSVVIYF